MVALLLAGLLLFVRGRTILAGVVATLGALVKPPALLALPVFWRPWDWRLPLAVGLTVVLAYLPYLSVGTGVLGFLPAYLQEEGFASGRGAASSCCGWRSRSWARCPTAARSTSASPRWR